jgi:NAD(P)H dehydrogenase (quinone)
MFAITGVTGNVGGEVARRLLTVGKPVRAIVRDARKGTPWKELDCEVAVADIGDPEALARAFAGAEGIFALVPPNFDPTPGFHDARAIATTLRSPRTGQIELKTVPKTPIERETS